MCKIIEIKDSGAEIRTPRELLDETPEIDELICAEGYTMLDMDSCLCQIDVEKTLNNAGIKFEETPMGYVVTANNSDVELALKMNKLVHDECKDVPHDIGLRLLEIVKEYSQTEEEYVYEALYNPDVNESVPTTISVHKTRKGAEMAVEFHKNEMREEYEKMMDESEGEMVSYLHYDHGVSWDVVKTRLLQ